ncbi:MAG: hypothetical protein KDD53_06210, partial [Bdellovibrionales bacterium]|nr:hypothetical protein [Bdellovibrionales bacterium]
FALVAVCGGVAIAWREAELNRTQLGNLAEGIERLCRIFQKLPPQGLGFVLIAVLSVLAVDRWKTRSEILSFPDAAVDFLISANIPGPTLNLFGDGGYLMYRFSDREGKVDRLVSIDGRTNVNPPTVMRAHNQAVVGSLKWSEYFALVNPKSVLWRNEGPLTAILMESPEWCLAYQDGTPERGYSVFVEHKSVNSLKVKGCPS